MKIKKLNIVKRAVPVLISAIAVSALYTSHSFAGTNTIPWSDVMLGDSLSIGAGYYEDDTIIQIPTKQQVIERHEINIDDLVEYDDTLEGISSLTASYYSSGNNDTLGVGITSSSGNKEVALSTSGASNLNLGINESITLPSGYYANPIIIKNGVANRGSLSFSPSAKQSITLQAGYYNGGTLDSTSAYNQGYSDGYAQRAAGTVSYIYHHHIASGINIHASDSASATGSIADGYQSSVSAGCFTKPYYHIKYNETSTAPCYHTNYWVEGVSDDPSQMDTQVYYHCSDCGATAGDQDSNRDVRLTAWRRFQDLPPGTKTVSTPKDYWTYDSTDHPGNRVTTVYTRSCGLTDGQIVSATITF